MANIAAFIAFAVNAIQLTHSERELAPQNGLKIMKSVILYEKQTFSQKDFHNTHCLAA
jgi:hypothetical protein